MANYSGFYSGDIKVLSTEKVLDSAGKEAQITLKLDKTSALVTALINAEEIFINGVKIKIRR